MAPIQPGGHGGLPDSLVRPDRKNFAPRIGFAWKPLPNTVVRGGYGINYNTGAYQGIAQQLALQPPFATTATNIQTAPGELTLQKRISRAGFWRHHQQLCGESELPPGLCADSQSGSFNSRFAPLCC